MWQLMKEQSVWSVQRWFASEDDCIIAICSFILLPPGCRYHSCSGGLAAVSWPHTLLLLLCRVLTVKLTKNTKSIPYDYILLYWSWIKVGLFYVMTTILPYCMHETLTSAISHSYNTLHCWLSICYSYSCHSAWKIVLSHCCDSLKHMTSLRSLRDSGFAAGELNNTWIWNPSS